MTWLLFFAGIYLFLMVAAFFIVITLGKAAKQGDRMISLEETQAEQTPPSHKDPEQ